MNLTSLVLLMPITAAGVAFGAVTYTHDVAPIMMTKCVGCHRPGEVAPMAFTNYEETRPWAKAIKSAVVARKMPVWLADPSHGTFSNDRRLSPQEIATIAAWVDAGAPEGDPQVTPKMPEFPDGWNIGKPDLVLDMGADFNVPKEGVVPYKYFTVDPHFTEDKWVESAEIRPIARTAMHHVIVFVVEPDAGKGGRQRGEGAGGPGNILVGYAPGEQPGILPPGTAKLVRAGSKLMFQLHYTPNGKELVDRSLVAMRFSKEPPKLQVMTGNAINYSFKIPPNTDNFEVKSSYTAKKDIDIVMLMPHMHVRGKDFEYTIVYPDGRSEVALHVPRYDFNWQLQYALAKPIHLPTGARIDCVAHFDNSVNNAANPNPNSEVKWGDQTWEEMMIGFFDYVLPVQPKPAVETAVGQ